MSVEVSVVLPAYNEAGTLESTVERSLSRLAALLAPGSYELIIAEDGCEDRTPELAAALAAADDRVEHVHSGARLGRGRALERAFETASGETLVYYDTDLATDMRHLGELIEAVRSGEYAIATGSRWMTGRVADRPARRGIPSRFYNASARLLLGSELRDHQCGFKAFDRSALETLLPAVEDGHWFWDTELLVRAQRAGYPIKEFPVDWEPDGDTSVELVRDVFGMGGQMLRTWWEFGVAPRLTPRVSLAAGSIGVLVAVALMSLYLDPRAVLGALERADPALLGIAAVLYVLSWPIRGARYRAILRQMGHGEGLWFLTGTIFISQTGNLVVPARAGDGLRAYLLKMRRAIPYPSGVASLAVERVFDLLAITALAGGALLAVSVAGGELGGLEALPPAYRESGRVAIRLSALVAGLAIVGLVGLVGAVRTGRGDGVRRLVGAISGDSYADRLATIIEGFLGDIGDVVTDGRAFGQVGATSLLVWSVDVLTAALVFAALGVGLAPLTLVGVAFLAVSVGNLAKVLPLSPGGIGLYEGAFTLIVVGATGVTWPVALAAAVLDHALKNLVTVGGGVLATLALNVSLTEAVDRAAELEESDGPQPEADGEL